ncbi:MAG: cell division topological specificity factor MinE [Clostridiales bacterium]|nr:cell division topological specificity factor MinE [Clostridiales bacterium]
MRQFFLFYKGNSGEIARNRLKLALISDETQVTPGLIEMIRGDLIDVISRYADFDPGQVELRMSRDTCSDDVLPALCARIPIRQFTRLRNE